MKDDLISLTVSEFTYLNRYEELFPQKIRSELILAIRKVKMWKSLPKCRGMKAMLGKVGLVPQHIDWKRDRNLNKQQHFLRLLDTPEARRTTLCHQ